MTMPPEPPGPPGPPPPPPGPPTPPPAGRRVPAAACPAAAAGVPRPGELLNRFLARLIDHVILGVVFVPIYIVLSAIIYSGFSNSFGEQFIFYTLSAIIQAALYLGVLRVAGVEPRPDRRQDDHEAAHLRPRRRQQPDDAARRVKRNAYSALGVLSIIPIIGWFFLGWAAPLAAIIFIAITLNNDQPNHQGWHDKFAGGTQVKQIG